MATGYRTSELLAAKKEGATILNVHEQEVTYTPRPQGDSKHIDRRPWLVNGRPDSDEFRYSAGECHPVGHGGGPWSVGQLLIL